MNLSGKQFQENMKKFSNLRYNSDSENIKQSPFYSLLFVINGTVGITILQEPKSNAKSIPYMDNTIS